MNNNKNNFKTLFLSLSILITSTIFAFKLVKKETKVDSISEIQFHNGTFKEALDLAKKENKLIFLDVYATWCGPCKKMKSKTFTNSEVGEYFNKNFINVMLDGEKSEGVEISNKYGVTAYPTLLFINGDGTVVYSIAGFHNPKELIELGKSVIKK